MTARLTSRVRAIALMVTALAMGALGSPVASAADPASAAQAADAASGSTAAAAAARYTVKPGQSLNDVAIAVTQSHDKAVLARAAKAIFDANPSAFMRGDPSLMKLGAVLNVPVLDASGAVAQTPAAAAVSASASAASPSPVSTPAVTGAAAVASSPVLASAPASASAAAGRAASATGAAALPQAASRPQANAAAPAVAPTPASATVGHAWTGAIQPAASSPAASGAVASTADQASIAAPTVAPSVPKAVAASGTTSAAAPAVADRAHTFSSLQQLLALKNRVLMDLQRHGFGSRSEHGAADHAVSASGASAATAAPAAQPRSEREGGKPPFAHGTIPGFGERFIGIGGYGISVPRGSVPVIAAIVSAVVAALLVLIVGFALSRRKRRAARAVTPEQSPISAGTSTASAPPADTREASAVPLDVDEDPVAAEFVSILARNPTSKRALMGLAARYAERNNARGFDEIAQRIRRLSGGSGPNWLHVAALGRQLDPDNPLYATDEAPSEDVSALSGTSAPEPVPPHSSGAQQALTDHEPHAGDAARGEALPPPPDEVSAAVDTDTFTHEVAHKAEPPPPEQPSKPELAASVPAEDVTSTDKRAVAEEPATLSEAAEAKAEPEALGAPDAEHEHSQPRFPAEAIAALSELDMRLPPRVESPAVTGSAIKPARPAEPAELPHDPSHTDKTHQTDETNQTSSAPPDGAAQWEALPHPPAAQGEAHGLPSDESAPHPSEAKPTAAPSAPPAVAGLGAARFGPLNLAFDLDLPSDGHTPSPAPTALAPSAMFTAEEMATIARNKLELAAEYIALGDVGGARTLIHEVIESNDSGTREEAHALLATLAPLS